MKTLTPRQLTNRIKKENLIIEQHKAQKPVASLKINIEWHKSRTWGYCPNASVWVTYKDGSTDFSEGYKASGYGYDKESTVIAEIFNNYLRYKLYEKRELKSRINQEEVNHPYGVYYYNGTTDKQTESGYIFKPSFNGGVGTSCYYKIAEFIGGKFENVANGKAFGCFTYTDNN